MFSVNPPLLNESAKWQKANNLLEVMEDEALN